MQVDRPISHEQMACPSHMTLATAARESLCIPGTLANQRHKGSIDIDINEIDIIHGQLIQFSDCIYPHIPILYICRTCWLGNVPTWSILASFEQVQLHADKNVWSQRHTLHTEAWPHHHLLFTASFWRNRWVFSSHRMRGEVRNQMVCKQMESKLQSWRLNSQLLLLPLGGLWDWRTPLVN